GAVVVAAHPFPDHHPFGEAEIARLRQEAARAGARLVTTAKDWVRLPPPLRAGIEVLDIEIVWRDGDRVAHLLADVLGQDPAQTPADAGETPPAEQPAAISWKHRAEAGAAALFFAAMA